MRLSLKLPLLALLTFAAPAFAAEPLVIDLWPAGKVPSETADLGPEKLTKKGDVVTSITNVSKPTIEIHPAPKDKATGIAIVIAPGGGYANLAWDHEGEQIADWANSVGITGIVLKYRVPRRPDQAKDKPPIWALQDAQRAMGIVRSKASEWGLDQKKIGFLGFSAGGHLTAWITTDYEKRAYEPIDDADKLSAKPDFGILIYPGGVVENGTLNLKPEIKITKETPPSFLAVASNDKTDNVIALFQAYKAANVPTELHIYNKGGHGFGIRPSAGAAATWPKRAEEWLAAIGITDPPTAKVQATK